MYSVNVFIIYGFTYRPGKSFDKLLPEIQAKVKDVLEKDYIAS
jgi:hypothetical protein